MLVQVLVLVLVPELVLERELVPKWAQLHQHQQNLHQETPLVQARMHQRGVLPPQHKPAVMVQVTHLVRKQLLHRFQQVPWWWEAQQSLAPLLLSHLHNGKRPRKRH